MKSAENIVLKKLHEIVFFFVCGVHCFGLADLSLIPKGPKSLKMNVLYVKHVHLEISRLFAHVSIFSAGINQPGLLKAQSSYLSDFFWANSFRNIPHPSEKECAQIIEKK